MVAIEVIDAEVKWYEDYGNEPKLVLYVDELPDRDELRFEGGRDEGLWYAEHESGYVEFFSWRGGHGEGYAGRYFDITTVDGRDVTLKGPYSSRAGVLNREGYGPCLDVTYRTDPDRDRGGRSGAVTLDVAREAVAEHLDGVELVREERFDDEPYWIPRRTEGENQ